MLQIEWKSSHYHSDGRRRSRPKPSTVHGWLVKWRATFSGNEHLRKEGIREMCEARAVRELKKQRKAAKATRQAKAGAFKSSFRLWPFSLGKKEQPQARRELYHASQRSSPKPPSRSSTRRLTSPTPSPKTTPARSRQPSHNRQGSVLHSSRSSRKASHGSRRGTDRAAESKR
ncbi:hypothetical protein JVU11DRAFT_1683 [Chiua virens]|nr:hypothetical protein JVU11DRAFT_1683 [Chiua virens]